MADIKQVKVKGMAVIFVDDQTCVWDQTVGNSTYAQMGISGYQWISNRDMPDPAPPYSNSDYWAPITVYVNAQDMLEWCIFE